MTSEAGFSSLPSGLQKSSIKELMGLGGGNGPSVLNYPKCTRPRAGWRGGGGALPAWLPSVSCLASCLPPSLGPQVPQFPFPCFSCLWGGEAEVRVQEPRVMGAGDGCDLGLVLQMQSLRQGFLFQWEMRGWEGSDGSRTGQRNGAGGRLVSHWGALELESSTELVLPQCKRLMQFSAEDGGQLFVAVSGDSEQLEEGCPRQKGNLGGVPRGGHLADPWERTPLERKQACPLLLF